MKSKNQESYNIIDFSNKELLINPRFNSESKVDQDFSKIFHEELEIKFFYEGSATLMIGKETIVTEPGDTVVINPYEFHSTIDCGEEAGKYHILMINLDFFRGGDSDWLDLRHILIGERTSFQTLIKNDWQIGELIRRIAVEFHEEKPMYEYLVRGMMLELMAILLRKYKAKTPLNCPTDSSLRYYHIISPAIESIRKDYTKHFSIEELADMCQISKYHFCRIFRQVTGQSVVQYQTEYRMQIAETLLENSDKSITEIAAFCGFEDVCYFSRCYKKLKGVSPKKNRARLSK